MIAVITKGNKVSSMVYYNENKIAKGDATKLFSNGFLLDNKSLYITQFEQMIKESKVENPTFHTFISLPSDEKIDDKTFSSIASDYMNNLGYGDQPYVVYRHYDRDHPHLHIVSVNVNFDGVKIDDYYQQKKSQSITRELEIAYGLQIVSSQKQTLTDVINNYAPKGVKSYIGKRTYEIAQKYKPTNYTDLKVLLTNAGISMGEVIKDSSVTGLVFRLDHDKEAKPIQSKDLFHSFTPEKLDRFFKKNELIKEKRLGERRTIIENKIYNLLNRYTDLTIPTLKDKLRLEGLEAVLNYNSKGEIFGWNIIDHTSGCVFKASEINRNLSWNKITKKVGKNDTLITKTQTPLQISKEFYSELNKQLYKSFRVLYQKFRDDFPKQSDFLKHKFSESLLVEHVNSSRKINDFIYKNNITNEYLENTISTFVKNQYRKLDQIIEKEMIEGTLEAGLADLIKEYKPIFQKRTDVIQNMLKKELLLDFSFKSNWFNSIEDKGKYKDLIIKESEKFINKKLEALEKSKATEAYLNIFNEYYYKHFNEKIKESGLDFSKFETKFNIKDIDKLVRKDDRVSQIINLYQPKIGDDHMNSVLGFGETVFENRMDELEPKFIKTFIDNELNNLYWSEIKAKKELSIDQLDYIQNHLQFDSIKVKFIKEFQEHLSQNLLDPIVEKTIDDSINALIKEKEALTDLLIINKTINEVYSDLLTKAFKEKRISKQSEFIVSLLNPETLYTEVIQSDAIKNNTNDINELLLKRINNFVLMQNKKLPIIKCKEDLNDLIEASYNNIIKNNLQLNGNLISETIQNHINYFAIYHNLISSQGYSGFINNTALSQEEKQKLIQTKIENKVKASFDEIPRYQLTEVLFKEGGTIYNSLRENSVFKKESDFIRSLNKSILISEIGKSIPVKDVIGKVGESFTDDQLLAIIDSHAQKILDFKLSNLDQVINYEQSIEEAFRNSLLSSILNIGTTNSQGLNNKKNDKKNRKPKF